MYSSRMRTARFNGHLGGGVVVCPWSGVEVSASGLGDVCLWSHWVSACGLGDVCLWAGGLSASGPGGVCLCLPSDSPWADTSPGQSSHLGRHPLPCPVHARIHKSLSLGTESQTSFVGGNKNLV